MRRLLVFLVAGALILSALPAVFGRAYACRGAGPDGLPHRDSLAADFSCLVRLLEETHPDPYTGFGGKVFFRKAAFELENEIRKNDYTQQQFADKVTAFLANLQDGHTAVFSSKEMQGKEKSKLLIGMRAIPGGLIVSTLPADLKEYLGSRIERINGMSLDSVLHEISIRTACENRYGAYACLSANSSRKESLLRAVFPEMTTEAVFGVITPSGKNQELKIPFVSAEEAGKTERVSLPHDKAIPRYRNMEYGFLDASRNVMLFRLKSIMARENYEFVLKNKWSGAYEQIADFYRRELGGKKIPADTAAALAGIPSFSETFLKMLGEMKKNNARVLIIDLRGNGGGWTPITLPSLYMLYGDRYLNTAMNADFYRLVSPLLLKKQNMTLEEFNKNNGGNFRLGDYTFYEPGEFTAPDEETRRKNFIDYSLSASRDQMHEQNGEPYYTPEKVYVLTDERTFSAAFHYAFYLWKMGAAVAGVPSRQAPNTYMEQTPFRLPYTGLEGSISNSMQVFLPGKDPRAKTFRPDIMLTYDDYRRYGFDENAELLYLLDINR